MGSWGEDLLENDAAMDFVEIWNEYIAKNIETDPQFWSSKKITAFFKNIYFKNVYDFDDTHFNSEVLALGVLYIKSNLEINEDLKGLLENAINSELKKEHLQEWGDSRKRKKILINFLKEIGGEKKENLSNRKNDEIDELKEFTNRFKQWIETVTLNKLDEDFEILFPPNFLRPILKNLSKNIGYSTASDVKLIQLRLMVLAFYVAWKVHCTDKEIWDFIQKAKKTKGHVFF